MSERSRFVNKDVLQSWFNENYYIYSVSFCISIKNLIESLISHSSLARCLTCVTLVKSVVHFTEQLTTNKKRSRVFKKEESEQGSEWPAPKCRSKYTTSVLPNLVIRFVDIVVAKIPPLIAKFSLEPCNYKISKKYVIQHECNLQGRKSKYSITRQMLKAPPLILESTFLGLSKIPNRGVLICSKIWSKKF